MKANGWEFASHTWGHVRVGDRSLASLKVDTQKWKENIEPIVGTTDTIIFAHGQDLQGPGAYDSSNAKYQYFREQGYRIFCNVDSTQYQTFLGEDYMRQGRRNLDGYRIYKCAIGAQDKVSDLFDAAKIMDKKRPPVPEL
jgi:peptidoglycan/xylan/chitin deacetylase (PgdA/CDA1 family)